MQYEGMVYRPPSEARSFILQITIGCARNDCTFCTMFKDKKFRMRKMDEIKADIADVHSRLGDRIRRIFLADGDALVMPTDRLVEVLRDLKEKFPSTERIAIYGAPGDCLLKTPEELELLKAEGLDMVYMGMESGNDEVLRRVKKHATVQEIVDAGLRVQQAGLITSVTLISGLGGRELMREHALDCAKAITALKPNYLGFLTLILENDAPMKKEIAEGKMELLTPDEVLEEMELFLSNVDSEGTVFRSNHASNYVPLGGVLNKDIPQMLETIRVAKENQLYRNEGFRAL